MVALGPGCDASPSPPAGSASASAAAESATPPASSSGDALTDIGTIGGSEAPRYAPQGNVTFGVTSHPAVPNSADQLERLQVFFRRCYRRELVRDPLVEGKAKVELFVGSDGAVTDAQITETTLPKDLLMCLRARARALQFEPPKDGGATVAIPVTFSLPKAR